MSYSKVIPIGNAGSLNISEAGGVAKLDIAIAESLGGGNIAGVAKASVAIGVEVSALLLMDAGMDLAASKFPQFAAEIALVKGALDAEAAKL